MVSKPGCKLTGSRAKGLRLQHPKRGLLPTKVVNGCPQLPNDVALEVVQELELHHRSRGDTTISELYQAVLLHHLSEDPVQALRDYVHGGLWEFRVF